MHERISLLVYFHFREREILHSYPHIGNWNPPYPEKNHFIFFLFLWGKCVAPNSWRRGQMETWIPLVAQKHPCNVFGCNFCYPEFVSTLYKYHLLQARVSLWYWLLMSHFPSLCFWFWPPYVFGSDHPSPNKIYWWITVRICYSIIGFSVFSLDLFGHGRLSALLCWHLIFELDDWSLLSVFYPGVWSVVSEPEYISSLLSACSALVFCCSKLQMQLASSLLNLF